MLKNRGIPLETRFGVSLDVLEQSKCHICIISWLLVIKNHFEEMTDTLDFFFSKTTEMNASVEDFAKLIGRLY